MDHQVPQDNQPVENQLPASAPAETAPSAPVEPAATQPAAPAPAEKPEKGIGKIDLAALASFSFGTQWTPAETPREARGDRFERGDRGPRPERRSFPGGGDRGDSRPDRRPAGRPFNPGAGAPGASPASAGAPRPERSFQGGRPQGAGDFRRDPRPAPQGGPGGGAPGGGERRFERGPRFERPAPQDLRPYLSPFFEVTFYAEDTAFSALVKAVRASCHTYELFEIARVVLAKTDRFVVVVQRKADADGKCPPVFVTPVDGLPFENEDEAVQHVLRNHMAGFFDISEVEVEAPKGNFQFVMRCGHTGELLGPPNYHRYQNILQQHHAARLGNMPFERFRERLETVKEPEVIAQWTEKMKKATRYVWKGIAEPEKSPTFDSIEEARTYLLANARDKVVRSVDSVRFHGKLAETLPAGEIRAAAEGHLERQRRFPLDTANSLRGRLRREGFTIFKRGSKGVSFVCGVKRKFRLPGQVFSESISSLIAFIEKNPVVSVKELPAKYLGIAQIEAAPAASAEASLAATTPIAAAPSADEVKLKRLWMDLRWLVTEGYVTEYSDGKLFAAPPMSPQLQKSEEAANAAADEVEEAARAAAESTAPAQASPSVVQPAEPAPAVEPPAVESASEAAPAEPNPPATE